MFSQLARNTGAFLLLIAFPLNVFFDAFDGIDSKHLW